MTILPKSVDQPENITIPAAEATTGSPSRTEISIP